MRVFFTLIVLLASGSANANTIINANDNTIANPQAEQMARDLDLYLRLTKAMADSQREISISQELKKLEDYYQRHDMTFTYIANSALTCARAGGPKVKDDLIVETLQLPTMAELYKAIDGILVHNPYRKKTQTEVIAEYYAQDYIVVRAFFWNRLKKVTHSAKIYECFRMSTSLDQR